MHWQHSSELDHISTLASISGNLKLNHSMSRGMVIKRQGSKAIALSPPILAERVHEIPILEIPFLGVAISDWVDFEAHIDKLCWNVQHSTFALCGLVIYSLHALLLFEIVQATTLTRLLYAFPVWGIHQFRGVQIALMVFLENWIVLASFLFIFLLLKSTALELILQFSAHSYWTHATSFKTFSLPVRSIHTACNPGHINLKAT